MSRTGDQVAAEKQSTGDGRSASRAPLIASLAIVAALVAAWFLFPGFQEQLRQAWEVLRSGDRQRISDWVGQFGLWGPAMLVLAMTAQMFLIVIPSVVLMAVAVLAYGPVKGTLLAILAVLVASTVGYLVGRVIGAGRVERMIGEDKYEKMRGYIERYGLWSLVVFRLSPFLSNDAISFVGGLLHMRYLRFMLATTAGIAPLAIAIGAGGHSTAAMETAFAWVSAVGLALLVGFILYDRKYRGMESGPGEDANRVEP